MEKLELLPQILNLNSTLFDAVDYVKQNINTSSDINIILTDIKNVLKTISSQASMVLDKNKATEIHQISNKLLNCCNALISNQKSVHNFINSFNEWKNISENYFYLESIGAANTCGNDHNEKAIELLELVLSYNTQAQIKALAGFILSRKLSKQQPLKAYNLGMEAFEINNSLCENITQNDSHVHNYVYNKVEDNFFKECPICHKGTGSPYFCATPLLMSNYTSLFNPIKLWMKCSSCGQLYAYNFPQKLVRPQPDVEELGDKIYMNSRPQYLPIFGTILKRILSFSNGNKLLEVGAGTGELIATALEFGCEVEAVEISKRQSQRLNDLLEVEVHCMDFLKYNSSEKYDIITMGDVLEHIIDPTAAIKKAYELLENDGVIWISTPNFESGFSRIMKYSDSMWNEPWHIVYFSYSGLKELLCENGFIILDYEISTRYNGSMEVIARKA